MKTQELFLITLFSLIGASFASALDDKPRRGLRASAAQTAPRKLEEEYYEGDYYYADEEDADPADEAAKDLEYYYYYEDIDVAGSDRRRVEDYYYDDDELVDDVAGGVEESYGNITVNAATDFKDDDYYDYEDDDGEFL